MEQNSLLENESTETNSGPVECLGLTFENDEARRVHFTKLLAEKLKDPEFRKIEGFPIGTDEAILELSDPPFYTACPNPWLNEFISLWESQKEISDEDYHREPFAADVSEGKNDPIYNAHSYHTKVPYKAIMRYILHYTNPGDVVLDCFCGSGMTGVAAQKCNSKSIIKDMGYTVINDDIYENGNIVSKAGLRYSVLSDISPAAAHISNSYNSSISLKDKIEANQIITFLKKKYGFLYTTRHVNGDSAEINYTVWSDVFECEHCHKDVNFWDSAVCKDTYGVRDKFQCSSCGADLKKSNLKRKKTSYFDHVVGEVVERTELCPSLIHYKYKGKAYTKAPDRIDIENIRKADDLLIGLDFPKVLIPEGINTQQPKTSHGIERVDEFYFKRALFFLAQFKQMTKNRALLRFLSSSSMVLSKLYRFRSQGGKLGAGGGPMNGTLYIPSLIKEIPVLKVLSEHVKRSVHDIDLKGYSRLQGVSSATCLSSIADSSIDYAFIDPPFGANINYSELNCIWEGWLKVETNNKQEAIENKHQKKSIDDYRLLMKASFCELFRVLKPGKWLTVEFSNTKATVWNSIQSAITEAGFIVANISALDKRQGSFKAVTTSTAVKQDLVISAYKPIKSLESNVNSNSVNVEGVWDFISAHLEFLSVVKMSDNEIIPIPERDPRILYDQVVSYFVRHNHPVPISSAQFQIGLKNKFAERDGMFFLQHQVSEYDKARARSSSIKQLSIFVDDEASAIEWLRFELSNKPKTYSDIHPLFINELSGWKKNELQLELSTLLEQNFIKYDGKEEVPNQIHTYLSTNFKDMRGLAKDDPALVAKAKDRWYVPDPNKAGDLEKVRLRALLREFEVYKAEKKKIKQPRAEALRAGFNHCWENQDLQTILDISAKIPAAVLQEDEKLLMFYDNAVTLTSNTDDDWD
ncbi:DNA methylase [Alteromonas marina]|uniref:DNA methylase n=1 Tax=Alteromonas marina TaxID=203795 RepID=A0A0B3XLJ9_9ALTE|nr:DNA methyltransferase [Alteromonas marina]KHT46327.1 DNA methylase [Alteromonas marina]